ncbi:PAS domain-containing sensor histidine kinase [Sulfitobacter maritimus]|uniref:PAS domain-containing sensor histidine kinase n=1 Tax=Sulfitobacter maritimus TaxID=2741719 RepID=UPI0015841BCC|nr:PAS domain S-box protein [Sulfitobacter maritimus]
MFQGIATGTDPDASSMFRSIIQHSPFGVWVVDAAGFVVFRNRSAEAMFPGQKKDGIGSQISTLLPALSVKEGKLVCRSIGSGDLENIIALPRGLGGARYCEVSLSQFLGEGGRPFNIVSLNEVTSRLRAWQALKDQEERWNLALEGSQIGVFESDLRTGKGVASDAWYQLLGICDSDGRNSDEEWRARIHPDDRAMVEAIDAECIEGRVEKSEAKFRMRGADGSWRWMRSILRVTERDSAGDAVRLLGTMIDVTSLESAQNLAKARKEGLEMLMANAPVAMAVVALDGTFILLNDACYPLFGYSPGVLEQMSFWKLSETDTLGKVKAEVDEFLTGKINASRIEERYEKPDGTIIDIAIRLSVVRHEDPQDTRLVVQMVDITEKKRLESLKDDFVATVSHELRTPLASIHGALRLLTEEVGEGRSSRVDKLLELADRNSVRLTQVVNDLLDFQKLTAGHFTVSLADVDAVGLVQQTIVDNEPFADKFNVSFAADLPDQAVLVRADPQRLKQVVTNLLSNASKFSTTGGTVRICLNTADDACTIFVENDGPGISSEFGTRIFQPFSQQAEHLTRNREGTGLGLSISKELIENMGGEIGFTSTPHVATVFWVRLPLLGDGGCAL